MTAAKRTKTANVEHSGPPVDAYGNRWTVDPKDPARYVLVAHDDNDPDNGGEA